MAEAILDSCGTILLALLAALVPFMSKRLAPALMAWLESKLGVEPCASCGARRRRRKPRALPPPG
jgi:hypothetical protein